MKQISFAITLLTILLLASCGPSAEEVATMTASAWTATPVPTATPTLTLTPTPIPYDLMVKVTDLDSNPVVGASVAFPESGDDNPVSADEGGLVVWTNLDGEDGSLSISAQGYLPAEQALSLERGPNEVTVALERDPYGLLPSEACAPGETLAYAEDFQDGVADGWPEIQFNAPGWSLVSDPYDPSDFVISASYPGDTGEGPFGSNLQGYAFENAVWRIRYLIDGRITGNTYFSLNWLQAPEPFDVGGVEVFDSRYQLPFNQNSFHMRRLQQPILNIQVATGRYPKEGEWHYVEMGTYQGYTEVWVDGVLNMSYQDPEPLPAGGLGLEAWLPDESVAFYFDDVSLCELSAPYVPGSTPTPAP